MAKFKPVSVEEYRRMVAAEIAYYNWKAPDLSVVPLPTKEETDRILAASEWGSLEPGGPGDKPDSDTPSRFQIAFQELDDVRQ